MSMEVLLADLKANLAELAKFSALTTMDELVRHLKDSVWPTMEAIVEEVADIDKCVQEQVSGMAELLHPESGAVLSAVVTGALAVSAALKARITKETEPQLYKVIEELEHNCKEAEEILEEIVLEEEDDEYDDDDEGDDDGEGEGEGDGDDDEGDE